MPEILSDNGHSCLPLNPPNVLGLPALRALGHLELHLLTFLQAAKAASLNCGEMHEDQKPFQPYHQTVTSFLSVLRHWGGIGVLILAALDSSVLPTLGGVDALTILLAARHPELWPCYAMCSTAGSVGGASVAYRLSGLGVLHRRIKGAVFDRVTAFVREAFWEPRSVARRAASASISDFRIRDLGWCNALLLHCVCAVFWCRAGVPICFTSLFRFCVC